MTRHLPRDRQFEQSEKDALASATLSIIVPVHDASKVTERCLMSLQKYAPKAEVILVDDASKHGETKQLLDDFSGRNGWMLIRHPKTLGHSAACNAGAVLATRPYLCLLNSDTVVTPWCWRLITQAFEADPEIGVAGPSTSSSKTEQTLALPHFTRRYLNNSQVFSYAFGLLAESSVPILINLPWVSGFAFFIRRGLWEQLSGFDQHIPDYGNEVELCKRVLLAGYQVVWVRNSYIHHLGGISYDKSIGEASVWMRSRSARDYIRQKYPDRGV